MLCRRGALSLHHEEHIFEGDNSRSLWPTHERCEFPFLLELLKLKANLPNLLIPQIAHLHLHSICHRDIKFENILLTREPGTGRLLIKLSDLGMATFQPPGTLLSTSCGSPHYASPQLVAGKDYDGAEADVWSCGVVLFALITGTLPFDDDNVPSLLCKIVEGDYKIPASVSMTARDLISRMLSVNPVTRIKVSCQRWICQWRWDWELTPPEKLRRRLMSSIIHSFSDVLRLLDIPLRFHFQERIGTCPNSVKISIQYF